MRFKQFLAENTVNFMNDYQEIFDYLIGKGYSDNDFQIIHQPLPRPATEYVKFDDDVYLSQLGLVDGHLPFRISEIGGVFDATGSDITTLAGCPTYHWQQFIVKDCKKLTSLNGVPKILRDNLNIQNSGITSLVGIADLIERIDGNLIIDGTKITEGGLGLIMIEDIYILNMSTDGNSPGYKAFKIINEYLGKPDDLFECQAELIHAGLEAYAQL